MKRSNARASLRSKIAAVALCVALASLQTALLAPPAKAMGAGGDTVRSLYDTLMATMRNGPALGARGRYAQIAPTIRRAFDIPFMTRLAVGPEWTGLTEAQRQ